MDKEKLEKGDYTGFSEKKAAQAVDKVPGQGSKAPVTLFSPKKKFVKSKKIVIFE